MANISALAWSKPDFIDSDNVSVIEKGNFQFKKIKNPGTMQPLTK